jgi:hypothetical protein
MPFYINFIKKKKNTTTNHSIYKINKSNFNINFWNLQNNLIKTSNSIQICYNSITINNHTNQYEDLFIRLKLPDNFIKLLAKAYYNIIWFYDVSLFELWSKLFFSRFTLKNFPKYINILKIFTNSINKNKNFIGLLIKCKGKFGGYGNARKKKLYLSKLPNYKPISPKKYTPIHFNLKSYFFLIFTTTGVSSTLFLIKHIH